MAIIDPALAEALAAGRPVQLDLGSGGAGRDGTFGVDHLERPGVALVANLNAPLTALPDACADRIISRHALEHVDDFLGLMGEIWRIARPDAAIEITVPHFSNVFGYSDPTHVRFFGLYTMSYFAEADDQPFDRKVPAFYTGTRFVIDDVRVQFYRLNLLDRLFVPLLSRFVNAAPWTQEFYERRLSGLFRAWQITYHLRPAK